MSNPESARPLGCTRAHRSPAPPEPRVRNVPARAPSLGYVDTAAEPERATPAAERARLAAETRRRLVGRTRRVGRGRLGGTPPSQRPGKVGGPLDPPTLPPVVVAVLRSPAVDAIWAKLVVPLPDDRDEPPTSPSWRHAPSGDEATAAGEGR